MKYLSHSLTRVEILRSSCQTFHTQEKQFHPLKQVPHELLLVCYFNVYFFPNSSIANHFSSDAISILPFPAISRNSMRRGNNTGSAMRKMESVTITIIIKAMSTTARSGKTSAATMIRMLNANVSTGGNIRIDKKPHTTLRK